MLSTYQSYQLYTRDQAKAYQRAAAQSQNKRDESYYRENIGSVKSVDDFLKNPRLFAYAMKAYGLEDMTYAKAFMRKVLVSDLSDDKSFANKLSDTRYRDFAAAFNFGTDGAVASSAKIQSAEQQSDTLAGLRDNIASSVTVAIETAYIVKKLPGITSVDGLISDKRLLGDVMTAYGLNAETSATTVAAALKSDLSDPNSFVNRSGNAALKELVADFNFDEQGKVTTERIAQSKENFSAMAKLYMAVKGTDSSSKKAAAEESTYVWGVISQAHTIDSLLKDKRVVAYIGTAYGDPKIDTVKLRSVLTSDLGDYKSTANTLGAKYHDMAAAFAFDTDGSILREADTAVQNRSDIAYATRTYLQNAMETEAGNDNLGAKLALYFARKAPDITSAYQLLGDKALLKFTQTALALPTSSGADVDALARSITAKLDIKDLQDPAKVNKLVARFAALYDMQNGSTQQSMVLQLFGSSQNKTGLAL